MQPTEPIRPRRSSSSSSGSCPRIYTFLLLFIWALTRPIWPGPIRAHLGPRPGPGTPVGFHQGIVGPRKSNLFALYTFVCYVYLFVSPNFEVLVKLFSIYWFFVSFNEIYFFSTCFGFATADTPWTHLGFNLRQTCTQVCRKGARNIWAGSRARRAIFFQVSIQTVQTVTWGSVMCPSKVPY